MKTAAQRIGDNVRAEMARAGMTQTRLGEVLGLPQSAVSKRLRGQREFRGGELVAVAAALDVDIDVLIKAPAQQRAAGPALRRAGPVSSGCVPSEPRTSLATRSAND